MGFFISAVPVSPKIRTILGTFPHCARAATPLPSCSGFQAGEGGGAKQAQSH